MALQISERVGITDPNPKRHILGRTGLHGRYGVKHTSESESEDNADYLSTQKNIEKVLVHRELNASSGTARDSDSKSIGTNDISRSSMFKLQVDEMLLAVKPNYSKIVGPVDKALRRLKSLIESIDDREPVTVGSLNLAPRCSFMR